MRLEAFRPAALRTEEGYQTALDVFQGCLIQRTPRFDRILEETLLIPGVLERIVNGACCVLSCRSCLMESCLGLSVEGCNAFWAYLNAAVPKDTMDLSMNPAFRASEQLKTFLSSLTINIPADLMSKMPDGSRSLARPADLGMRPPIYMARRPRPTLKVSYPILSF